MLLASVWGDIWNGIVASLNYLLQAFYNFTGNYGVAIILLTILIKIVLLPLTIKQTKSMIAMQKIQPEIKKLQEKYKDDKEKLSQETMKFYKENKVNPLSGCLPLILQLPVFIALYTVLRKYLLTPPTLLVGRTLPAIAATIQLKAAGFLWMENLADTTRIADPTYIMIILLAASTWYSQRQVMTDPRQRNMMIIMPIITAFIGISLPAGVVLYWITTNILQILQQWGIEFYEKKHPSEEVKGKERREAQPKNAPVKGTSFLKGLLGMKEEPDSKKGTEQKGKQPAKAGQLAKGRQQPAKGKGNVKKNIEQGKKTQARQGTAKQKQESQKGKQKNVTVGKGGQKAQVRKPKGPPPKTGSSQKNKKPGKGSSKKQK